MSHKKIVSPYDKRKVVNIVKKYTNILKKEFNLKYVILFGSYVNGSPHKYSDIDVAVVLKRSSKNWLTTAAKLFSLTKDVDIRIEPILMDDKNDSSGFFEHVLSSGKIIYKKA